MQIYKTVKMMVVRRKSDFCFIFAKNRDGGHMLDAILRIHTLFVSSKNKKEKMSTRVH